MCKSCRITIVMVLITFTFLFTGVCVGSEKGDVYNEKIYVSMLETTQDQNTARKVYTIYTLNDSAKVSIPVLIKLYVPAGVQYRNKKNGMILKWPLGVLKSRGSRTIIIGFKVETAGSYKFKAEIVGEENGKILNETCYITQVKE